MNKKVTKNMTTDAKIRVAYNHIKNNTTYVNWNAAEGVYKQKFKFRPIKAYNFCNRVYKYTIWYGCISSRW
ncbi:hypothetical protein BN165_760030 [Clostridioides difficile E1]|nr:hypothetical protein BN163_810029 [Clostridioides difficile T5]CCK92768.1 hypothetical protein BN164_250104 [Clostridioides difficile T20]CCK97045.1 hypothetical protein BN165_760030 [Clostridioides difficile E1]CCL01083.1 hypothetical protein BN166_870029 [Clostridioides difficile E10]